MLTIKHFLKFKENSKLLLNMRLILSSNKIKLLQKKILHYFAKNLCETTEFDFLYFTSCLKKIGNYVFLSSQSNCPYLYALIINGFMCYIRTEIGSILIFKHEFTFYYPSSCIFKHFKLPIYKQSLFS